LYERFGFAPPDATLLERPGSKPAPWVAGGQPGAGARMPDDRDLRVALLEPGSAAEPGLAEDLAALINEVYATAERGLWREGATRTSAAGVAELIGARELAVATRGGRSVGTVRVHDVGAGTSELGMLAAAPDQRGTGIGRALLDFAEEVSRGRGMRTMRLELLVPRDGTHPTKEVLKVLYGRRGYRLRRTEPVEGSYPQLAPLLATPCDLAIYEKPLR
jgi:GNAT superfamily N-acetyltransferase